MTRRYRLKHSFEGLHYGGWMVGPIGVRARVEGYYLKHPNATQEQVRLATKAPRKTVRRVFDALVLAGRLKPANGKAMVRHCDDE